MVPLVGVPFNLGPLVLLVITKFIIPRSSFVGHLSGIIIGLPLVWGWLDWLTPPVLVSILLALLLYSRDLNVRKYAGYNYGTQYQELPQTSSPHISSAGVDNSVNYGAESGSEREFLEGFLPSEVVNSYMTLKMVSYTCVLWTTAVIIYAAGGELVGAASALGSAAAVSKLVRLITFLGAVLSRLVCAYLAWSASHAKRITLVSDNSDTIKDCILVMVLAWGYALLLLFLDVMALALTLTCWRLIDVSVVGGAMLLCVILFF